MTHFIPVFFLPVDPDSAGGLATEDAAESAIAAAHMDRFPS